MSENSATANAGPLTNQEVAVRPRSKAKQKAKDRQRAFVVVAGFVLMAAVGALLAISNRMSSHTTEVISNNILRTAKVTSSSIDDKNCREQVFDNQTGRMTRLEQPCDANAFDSNGVTAPLGTIHRLDAISKSFSGR
jgi:hypothetical protein